MPSERQLTLARLAAAVLCIAALAACGDRQPQDANTDNGAIDKPPAQRLPIVEPPFDRDRLLLTVARAASAHSAGMNEPGAQRSLDGKQFEVRLRFGCDGPGPRTGEHGWSLDPDGRTLRLRAVPTLSLDDEVASGVAGDEVEAVEGFWLPRPWLLQAECPAREPTAVPDDPADEQASSGEVSPTPASTAPPAAAFQRIGIAQFFTAQDARTRRRMDRPFEAVKRLEEGERAGQDGFNLVLSGRLRARGDGRVILCSGSGRDRPPDCIVSAAVDRVWIERPSDKAVMAEWSM